MTTRWAHAALFHEVLGVLVGGTLGGILVWDMFVIRSACTGGPVTPHLAPSSRPKRPPSLTTQVTIVNSCYASKSPRPEQLLRCVRDEWHALRDAATVVPAPAEAEGGAAAAKAKAA